jgi:chromosome segregation ATPase
MEQQELFERINDIEAELRRVTSQVDTLIFERDALVKQRDQLIESNRKLKEECDNLRQLHFKENQTDWVEEYHNLFEKYQKLENYADRVTDQKENLLQRVQELEAQTAPRTRQTVCKECGEAFQENVKGRKAKFCSAACRKRHQRTEAEFNTVMSQNQNVTLLTRLT